MPKYKDYRIFVQGFITYFHLQIHGQNKGRPSLPYAPLFKYGLIYSHQADKGLNDSK